MDYKNIKKKVKDYFLMKPINPDYEKMWEELRGYLEEGIKVWKEELENGLTFSELALKEIQVREKLFAEMTRIEKEAEDV